MSSRVLDRSEVTEVSLNDIKQMALDSYDSLWAQARRLGRDVKIYLHWTAGRYTQFWNDYHIQIDYDGKIYVPDGVAFDDILSATYLRNTGSVSVTALCGVDCSSESPGVEAPLTAKQIEVMSQVVAVLANALDLTIDIFRVMTHGEAADNEDGIWLVDEDGPYGPKHTWERWDLEVLWNDESPVHDVWGVKGYKRGGDILRGKANWYRQEGIEGVYEPRKLGPTPA